MEFSKIIESKVKEIHEIDKKAQELSSARESKIKEWIELLGIQSLRFRTTQEYDDNNYFDRLLLTDMVVYGQNVIFSELDSGMIYEMEDYENEVTELQPCNSHDFINNDGDQENPYKGITFEQVKDIDHGELILAFLKKHGTIEYLMYFLEDVLYRRCDDLPDDWIRNW